MASGSGVKSSGRQAAATTRKPRGRAKSDHVSSTGRKRSRDKPAKEPRGSSSTSSTKQGKLVCTLTVVKGRRKARRGKEAGEGSQQEEKPQVSTKRRRGHGVLDSSQKTAQSPKPVKVKQRRRSRGASSVAGAEAGAQTEPSGPPGGPAQPRRRRRNLTHFGNRRKSLFGSKRKPGSVATSPTDPAKKRVRRRSVFYTLEPMVPLKQEDQGQAVEGAPGNQPHSGHLASPVVSARSSRVIKLPRRFLDEEEELPRPRGKGKSQGKPESDIDEDMYWSAELKPEGEQRTPKTEGRKTSVSSNLFKSSKMSPGSSHLLVYEKLKNLTSKLSRKNRDPGGTPEDGAEAGQDSSQTTVKQRRRRRSKLTMEELDSPGVVRKLAVLISGASTAGTVSAKDWEEGEYNAGSVKRKDFLRFPPSSPLTNLVHLTLSRRTLHFNNMLLLSRRGGVFLLLLHFATFIHLADAFAKDVCGATRGQMYLLSVLSSGEDGGVVVDQGDLSQRVHLSNRRMLHLVKRAKVQLIKIDQQKLLKSSQVRRRAGDSQTKPLECFSELWTWCTCGIQLLLSDWSVALCRCHNFDYSLLVYDAVGGVQRSGRRQTEEEEEEGEGSKPRWHNSGEGFFLS